MKAQLRVLSGARVGLIQVFSQAPIGLGRHSSSDLQFDPQRDLAVSAHHGSILWKDGHWLIRDLGSRNGILVNGRRIPGDTKLKHADRIQFGSDGPSLEFRLVSDDTPDGIMVAPGQPVVPLAPTAPAPGLPRAPIPSTTQRIRVEVGRQTRRWRVATVALLAGLAGLATVFLTLSDRQSRQRERERAAIEARSDSMVRAADDAVRALEGRIEALATALRASQAEVHRLSTELQTAQREGNDARVAALRRQLNQVGEELQYQQIAAQVDYRRIVDPNQRAVAMIYAEFGPGDVVTGTAFGARADGTMLTNRHIVAGADGTRRATRLGVRFADSDQFWPATLLAVAEDADLAVVKVNIRGGIPTVRALNPRPDTLKQGDPLALIGFPLGAELPMSTRGNRVVARTTFTPGSISKVLSDRLQLYGYGAPGASGSPIFDRNGEVVGILYGGQPESEGRILYGVPSNLAITLLGTL